MQILPKRIAYRKELFPLLGRLFLHRVKIEDSSKKIEYRIVPYGTQLLGCIFRHCGNLQKIVHFSIELMALVGVCCIWPGPMQWWAGSPRQVRKEAAETWSSCAVGCLATLFKSYALKKKFYKHRILFYAYKIFFVRISLEPCKHGRREANSTTMNLLSNVRRWAVFTITLRKGIWSDHTPRLNQEHLHTASSRACITTFYNSKKSPLQLFINRSFFK